MTLQKHCPILLMDISAKACHQYLWERNPAMSFIHELAYHQTGRIPIVHHRHTDYNCLELVQVLKGGGNALIGDQVHPLLPGTLLFIDSSSVHAINPEQDELYCRNKLLVEKTALTQALQAIDAPHILDIFTAHGGCSFVPDSHTSAVIDQVFLSLYQEQPSNSSALWAILHMLRLAGTEINQPKPQADSRIQAALQYINDHFAEPLTTQRIAAETMLSKYYLCHLFREHTGLTVMQYLNEQRLAAARKLLIKTNRPIVEIAQDCGFNTSSHFCSFFHKQEGMSPRDFRKQNQAFG